MSEGFIRGKGKDEIFKEGYSLETIWKEKR